MIEEDRAITVTIASPHVPGSPNYRLMLRNRAVRETLEHFRPDLIECQDAYNLPWAAIGYRKRHPETALVAAYMTDFPTVYVERPFSKFIGRPLASLCGRICYSYCGALYRRFDEVFALGENGGGAKLRSYGVDHVGVVPLGVELGEFGPPRRDAKLRQKLGLTDNQPLLIYVGRLDGEKKPDVVVEAFRSLAPRARRQAGADRRRAAQGGDRGARRRGIIMPGYVRDRTELARWLASADIYVSAMADETFGVSIVEAQASGLPVVGVAAGAMLDRVDRRDRAAWGRSATAPRWRKTSWRCGTAIAPGWPIRPARRRFSSAGSAAWKRCSARFIRRRSQGAPSSGWRRGPRQPRRSSTPDRFNGGSRGRRKV